MYVTCKQTVEEFGEIKFKDQGIYEVERIHDLLLIKGEKNAQGFRIIFQIESFETNHWFCQHFSVILPANQLIRQAV